MPTLEDAILLAVKAHQGQKERDGIMPYILHPLRVMLHVQFDEEAMMAAVLHDVVEDTDMTLDDLRELGYPEAVVVAVDHLTRREDETYQEFVLRIKPNVLARRVKLADLEDNMDVRRLLEVTPEDATRLQRYRRAWKVITGDQRE